MDTAYAYGGSKIYFIFVSLVTEITSVSTHCKKAQVSVTLSYKITTQLQLTSCLLQHKPKSGRYTCTFAVLTTMWIHCLRTHGSLPTPPTTTQTTNHHQPPTNIDSAVRKLYIHLSSGGRGEPALATSTLMSPSFSTIKGAESLTLWYVSYMRPRTFLEDILSCRCGRCSS